MDQELDPRARIAIMQAELMRPEIERCRRLGYIFPIGAIVTGIIGLIMVLVLILTD